MRVVKTYKKSTLKAKRNPSFQNGGTIATKDETVITKDGTSYEEIMNHAIKKKGGTKEQYNELMDSIAFHETGSQQRMNPNAVQLISKNKKLVPLGDGRGMFMFEVGDGRGGITAVNRTVKELKSNNLPVPEWLNKLYVEKSADFSKLDEEKQRYLFIGNYLQHPKADFSKYINGTQSIEDWWSTNHHAGAAEDKDARLASFRESQTAREKLKQKKP